MLRRHLALAALLLGGAWRLAALEIFPVDAEWKYFKGVTEASQPDATAWRAIDFDDSGWPTGRGPFYYENDPSSGTAYTGNTPLDDMRGGYTCVFLRKTFVVNNPADIKDLKLEATSDDGFIAWINDREVARFNMPQGEAPYNSSSLPALSEPVPVQSLTLTNPVSFLVRGTNVLALQAFNSSLSGSSDFLLQATLSSSVDQTPPTVASVIPAPSTLLRSLTQIEVFFSEAITGVDAEDLLINGLPATRLTPFAADQFVFEFPQPATGQVQVTWRPAHGIQDLASAPNLFADGGWTYTLDPHAVPPGLMISEFMSDDRKTLRDEDGDHSDWIELYNGGTSTASLSGWYLTDQTNNLAKWRFPNVSLLANSYLVVFASGKNRTNVAGRLHTNFKLNKSGGYLALVDPATNVVSEFGPSYPPQYPDVSYGRTRGNPGLLALFPTPTPGAPNSAGGPGFASAVDYSRPGGVFIDPFFLTLTCQDTNGVIRYTLDGSLPAASSPAYAGSILLTNTVQVRARVFTPGLLPGAPRSETYLALSAGVTNASSDLPLMIIHNFRGGSIPAGTRQFANFSVFEPLRGRSSLTNQPALSVRAGVSIRGSSTLYQTKKNFRLELWDEFDDGEDHPLLDLPSDNDWILYAPNNFEPVLIHNPYAHDLSRQIGRYSPRTRFVEVYVNTSGGPITAANYNGVYVLIEKIKSGPHRVDIPRLEPEHTRPPQVTGGYLMSVDRGAPGEGQIYAGGLGINCLDPKYDELMQPQRGAQAQYLTGYLDAMLAALNGPNFADPVNGYAKYVDLGAAIDHHILNVLTFNVDALRLSSFFYKPREGKLCFGPLWDFDRSLGSTDGRDANPRLWRSTSPDYGTDMFNADPIFSNPWYSRMFKDPDFWQRWIDRWQELRRRQFALTNLHGLVDSLAGQVREAQVREVKRWPGFTSPRTGSYQGEVNSMKTWLSNRVNFIDTNFLAAPVLSGSGGQIAPGYMLSISAPAGATVYYTLDGTDPRAAGGNLAANASVYSTPLSLTANARVTARARDLNHKNLTGANKPPLSSPWSGPAVATFVVSTPPLALTELMFHPPPPPAGNTNDADNFEYLELKNTGASPLSLIGFRFTQGLEFTFTATNGVTSLAPGAYVVIVRNRAAFAARYPQVTNVAGEYTGHLNNAGERLSLEGPLGEPILDFSYDPHWYPLTDGLGFSLVPADEQTPFSGWTNRASWRVSSQFNGSPGAADSAPPQIPPVLVNEALTHTDLPQVDAVELYNPALIPVDLGGWFLSDDLQEPRKFRIPEGRAIDAGGFITFDETDFSVGALNPFALSSLGDGLYLFSGDGVNLTGYFHGFQYGAAADGISFGRYVTSVGEERFVAQARTTLGQPNAGPKVGPVVINELMYQPPPEGTNNNTLDEYVELRNLTGQPVPLFDPAVPTNTWRIDGGITFRFPTNLTLAANGYLLLVSFDPALDLTALRAFQSKYDVGTNTPVFGPYAGFLENHGERVALYRPDPPEVAPSPDAGRVPYILVDELHYAGVAPWPAAAGSGNSLQRILGEGYGDDPVNWHSAAPTAGRPNPGGSSLDTDGDGLPDAWELAHGLDPKDATGDNGAAGDPDRDGLSNLQEYLAGTAPRDPGSCLRLESIGVSADSVVLHFNAIAGRTYTLFARDSLVTGAWVKQQAIPAQASSGLVTVVDPNSRAASARFYRLATP